MDRRSFIVSAAAGLALLGLPGCGGGSASETSGGFNGTGNILDVSQRVTGRIAPELVFTGAEVGSAYGPSTVTGDTFTTSISGRTVGLVALSDSSGGVRGFTLTFPGESPVFSAENSALAIIFLEPGFLRLDPGEARALIAGIRASSLFAPFVRLLLANASNRRLELLSGDPDYVTAREALTSSLASPFKAEPPVGRPEGKDIGTILNPSPRFLRVVRDGQVLPQFLPAYGALTGQPQASNYLFHGLGPASTLDEDTSLVEETYYPTLVFGVFIPWLELALGQKLPVEVGLTLVQRLQPPSFNPRTALVNPTTLASTLAQDSNSSLGAFGESLQTILEDVTKVITEGSYLAGLAFMVGAIMNFKQHKDNPTQEPLGTPRAMALIAAALLYLPAILDRLGQTIFDDPATPPSPY